MSPDLTREDLEEGEKLWAAISDSDRGLAFSDEVEDLLAATALTDWLWPRLPALLSAASRVPVLIEALEEAQQYVQAYAEGYAGSGPQQAVAADVNARIAAALTPADPEEDPNG